VCDTGIVRFRSLESVIRGLLFDFDGLLVDTESAELAAWRRLYDEHGQELALEHWAAAVGTLNGFDPLEHLEELVGAPLDRVALRARQRTHSLTLVEAELLRPGVTEYLLEAERLGLRRAIVSSGSRDWIDSHLARLEQLVGWDAIVSADGDVERAKPRPALYLEALDLLGLRPDEAIAFEDSTNGVRAAKAAGIVCIAVPNPVTATFAFDEADILVDSLATLPLASLLERVSAV
jgi:HAD superfamily hydrolase (TIGR01509 family)